MSNGSHFFRDLAGEVTDRIREDATDRLDARFEEGFNEAANICVNLLSKKIDGLLSQVKQGSYLSENEQFLLAQLNNLRSEAEAGLRGFWSNADGR